MDLPRPPRHAVALISGVFDPLHAGHLAYLRAAQQYGDLVCVLSDAPWKHPVVVPIDHRQRLLEALGVSFVHIVQDVKTEIPAFIEELKPQFYVKGSDWSGHLPGVERSACEKVGTTVVYTMTVQESSSRLLADYQRRVAEAAHD